MRHLKFAAVSVAVAAALAVLTVSAAAAAPRLAILEPTTTALAPNGYPNVASMFFFTTHSPEVFCSETAEGTLLNDRSSDRDRSRGHSTTAVRNGTLQISSRLPNTRWSAASNGSL